LLDYLKLHGIVAVFGEALEAVVFRPDSAYDHQGIPLLLLIRLEIPYCNKHSFLDQAHDVFVILDLDPALVA
jgi:hypothetical protein